MDVEIFRPAACVPCFVQSRWAIGKCVGGAPGISAAAGAWTQLHFLFGYLASWMCADGLGLHLHSGAPNLNAETATQPTCADGAILLGAHGKGRRLQGRNEGLGDFLSRIAFKKPLNEQLCEVERLQGPPGFTGEFLDRLDESRA